jgi:fatty-acyl-CoA synthase
MIYDLLDKTDPSEYDLSSLETILYAASPIFPSRLAQALKVFGNVFVQAYGQSESNAVGTVLLKEEHDPVNRASLLTSCGRPAPGCLLEIRDGDDLPVPAGTPGEICLRTPSAMTRYWKNPELTAEVMRGGWLHTGDMGMVDQAGYLHIVDRKKDMVITGGFNVYPREVEIAIAEDPDVAAVAVVGIRDERWGEAVTAYIVQRPGATVNADALKARLRESKGPYQSPKHVVFVEDLPLTPVGKIDKKRLRTLGLPEEEKS